MPNFEKAAGQGKKGWDDKTLTQTVGLGQDAEISLRGEGPKGEALVVQVSDPKILTVHELPATASKVRRLLITGLTKGKAALVAMPPFALNDGSLLSLYGPNPVGTMVKMATTMAMMNVEVTGSQHGFRLVFFPGERTVTQTDSDGNSSSTTVGTIYVVGGNGERYSAAGGPPAGWTNPNQGGHTADPTPPGQYVLGPRQHVTTTSWPMSVIPWGASLRINKGEAEYQDGNGRWRLATGPNGEVTRAMIQFQSRSRDKGLTTDQIIVAIRKIFIDPDTGTLLMTTWEYNDFGKWGWNLRALPGKTATAYYVHTTDQNERDAEAKLDILLENSHGCVHLVPSQRDEMIDKGYLVEGAEFDVRPYNEVGPP